MAFTVADFHDLVRLLEQHEEWRKELRRLLLTDELLNLPDTVHELRKEVNRRFAELARSIRDLSKTFTAHRQEFLAHQAQTEARFAELSAEVRALAEAQRRHYEEFTAQRAETDRRFAELSAEVRALAEAQRRTEEIIQQILLRQEQFQRTLDRFGQTIGVTVEGQMVEALQRYLRERGYALLEPITTLAIDQMGELDGVARVRGPDGNEAWVLVSVKARVSPRAVHEFVDLLRNTRVVQALQAYGIRGNVLPLIFGVTLDRRALEIARESQVGLLLQAQGELIAPRAWILETLEPS